MKVAQVDIYEAEIRPAEAAKHVANARHLLTELYNRLELPGDYPELPKAITHLEVALSMLTTETGGML